MSIKIHLTEDEMPRQWYNLNADLPTPVLPPVGPVANPTELLKMFPGPLLEQEMSPQRWIDIPEEVLQILYRWRPSPLRRAVYLEKMLGTPAKIFYKDESVSPAGSHKPNTAVAQAYYNKLVGTKTITTETGAGQWGSALAFACTLLGLKCKVFMVRASFEQKPFRKMMMETWGATCVASPSTETETGRGFLKTNPDHPGSLGIAISEALEATVSDTSGATKYSLGSVLNHVMLHQTIIGLEAQKQLQKAGIKKPDIVIGCAGGGSNFAGLAFPFVQEKINGAEITIIPVEPASCPSLTRGIFAYDYGDSVGKAPTVAMYTLGHGFVPDTIHAGGLRYHGMSPMVSQAVVEGLLKPRAVKQNECFEAALKWARTEGFIVAPETSHAIAVTIQEAIKAREEGKEKVILFNLSGHGLMDLVGYSKFLEGKLVDHELPQSEIDRAEAELKDFPKAEVRKTGRW